MRSAESNHPLGKRLINTLAPHRWECEGGDWALINTSKTPLLKVSGEWGSLAQ